MQKLFLASVLFVVAILFTGCCRCQDDDLRTTPVTNNPNIIPNTASVLPGMPANSSSIK